MKKRGSFDWKQFLKAVSVIAIPVALQNLLTTTGSMVDTMMLAPLGQQTVGAVGLCAQFSSLMFACYWGFVGGGMLFFGQYYGAKDDDGVNNAYGMTLTCMMTVGVIFALLAVLFPDVVMRLYTDKPHIQALGVEYLRIVGFAYPLQIYAMAASALLRSTGKAQVPLYGSVASVLVNVLLNWMLIGGRLGAPAMGMRGAAVATVCAAFVNAAVVMIAAHEQHHPYLTRFCRHFHWNRALIGAYFRKCLPIICNELLIGIGNMVINIVLGRQSEEAIAATAVFRTLEGLIIGFFAGFANASSVLVSNGVGSGELETAYQRARRLVYLCGSFIFCVCVVLLLVHRPILTAMSLSGESLAIGTGMLTIYCAAAVIRMCNWTQNDTFRAAGDATFGTVLEIAFMYGLMLPCVCAAGLWLKAPFLVIFACCYVDEPIRLLLMHRHLRSGKWIKPVTPQGQAALPAFLAAHSREKAKTQS